MASSTATLSAVLTLDDRASPGLVKTSQNSQRLGADLRSAGQSAAAFAGSMASLLIVTGALESKTGQYATATFALTGAFISLIPALQTINTLLQTNATIQAFLTTLKNPLVAGGVVAAAGAAAVGTGIFLASRAGSADSVTEELERQRPINTTIDLRGATIRGESDINALARRLNQQIPRTF